MFKGNNCKLNLVLSNGKISIFAFMQIYCPYLPADVCLAMNNTSRFANGSLVYKFVCITKLLNWHSGSTLYREWRTTLTDLDRTGSSCCPLSTVDTCWSAYYYPQGRGYIHNGDGTNYRLFFPQSFLIPGPELRTN